MNFLKNAGTHKILSIMTGINGETPLQLIELAGRTAYQSRNKITEDSARKFVQSLIKNGHESVLEHSGLTVEFNNVSIGMTRELCRHRLMSLTEKSTRYVDEKDFNFVIPPNLGNEETSWMTSALDMAENVYRDLRKLKVPAQDVRQILPLATVSQIVCTANFREWRHILKLRIHANSHWEIRRVMTSLLKDLKERIPVVFDDICSETDD